MPKLSEQTLINGATYGIDGTGYETQFCGNSHWCYRAIDADGDPWLPIYGLTADAYLASVPETFKLADVRLIEGTFMVTADGRRFSCEPGGICDDEWHAHDLPDDTPLIAAWDQHTPQTVIDEMEKRIAAVQNKQVRPIDEALAAGTITEFEVKKLAGSDPTDGYEFDGTPIRPVLSEFPEHQYNPNPTVDKAVADCYEIMRDPAATPDMKRQARHLLNSTYGQPAVPYNPVSAIAQPGYLPLANELFAALEQSQSGKGKERHANDKPFLEQPIMRIAEMTGPGGTAFQAIKKIQESLGMHGRGDTEAATRELHGAMVYAAATILAMRKDA